jgi:hypothetical protein
MRPLSLAYRYAALLLTYMNYYCIKITGISMFKFSLFIRTPSEYLIYIHCKHLILTYYSLGSISKPRQMLRH